MKKTNIFLSITAVATLMLILVFTGCKKPADGVDGAMGPQGPAGQDGVDANETCKLCHNATVVEAIAQEYDFSKHFTGLAAEEEVGRQECAPCHESEGFKYVCANNTPATFVIATGATTYSNQYTVPQANAIGNISCFTCHSSLHTTYNSTDLPALTTTAAVPMTMYGGSKTINLTADNGISNLCVKCHQPRPITTSTTSTGLGNVMDYAALVSAPNDTFYSRYTSSTNKVSLSFRSGNHYGSVGAIYAGMGGIEFGTGYSNSFHTNNASCQDCHMATRLNGSGGHTFVAKGNFNGCNTTDCHTGMSSTNTDYTGTKAAIKSLLDQLATKINTLGNGTNPILQVDATETNLWLGLSTGNYDGYLNIYNASSNPGGFYKTSGTTDRFPSLTNAQWGTIINFQLALREYSLGIHNTNYVTTLLTNSLSAW
ncbi:MAG: hypothetical protein HY951_04935 [Bacteroidia bacterium]|nr:hypothetical protein [Bacteroidia bacterium]